MRTCDGAAAPGLRCRIRATGLIPEGCQQASTVARIDEIEEVVEGLRGEVILVDPVRGVEERRRATGTDAGSAEPGDHQQRRQVEQLEDQRRPAQETDGVDRR